MAQAKREKIVYGDATEYKEDVKNGLIIPREPSKISDSLAEDVKKGRVVARPGQADTHLAHLSFTQEALLNGTATDKQEEIAKRYYVANIDAINADRKRHGLSPITVEEAVNAAKVVYEVLNNKGKESEELKKDVESGSVIYRRVNKDLEEEVLAKNVENVFITTTTTTTTRISTGPAAAPGGRGNGRVRRSTTEEAPAPETSGSPKQNKKNKGDQSSETVATELPHVAPDHGTTETGNAGEGARPNSGSVENNNTPVTPAPETGATPTPNPEVTPEVPVVTPEVPKPEPQPEPPVENTNPVTPQPEVPVTPTVPETTVPTPEPPVESNPVQPPSQPEDSVVTPSPAQPESPVETTPTPVVPHVETEEEKLAKYTEDDFAGSTGTWYDLEKPEIFYNLLPADSNMILERGKTYRLVAWNTNDNRAEYVNVMHPKDFLTEHIHANSMDYTIRPQDKPVPGGPYKDVVTMDWNTLNELDDNAPLHEYTNGLYYTSNQDLIPVFNHTKGLIWYDFDNVATTYDVDDANASSYLTGEFKMDVRKTGTEEIIYYTMPVLAQVFTQKVEYNGKTYWIRPQDNYVDEAHVKDIVMLDESKLNPALSNSIEAVNEAFTLVSNRVLHVETDEEKLAKYHQEDFSSSNVWYNLDNVHTIYMLLNDDVNKVIERGKTYKLVMLNSENEKAEFVEFKHIADVFTENVHANGIDYCVRPQDVYDSSNPEGKDIMVYEKSSYDAMPDQTLGTMTGIVYQSHTANLAPTPEVNTPTVPAENPAENTNDPVVQGKKFSEYKSDEFYKGSAIYIPEEPDEPYYIRNADFNLEISTNGIIEIVALGRNSYEKKVVTVADPKTVFTKKVNYAGEERYIRPEDMYDRHNVKNILAVPKEFIDICPTTLENYMNNSGNVYTLSNTDVTDPDTPAVTPEVPAPGHTEASPSPTPGHNTETTPNTPTESDPVIHGKKLSEYTTDDFDQSGSLIVPEDTSEEYLVLESDLDTVFAPGESKEILGMPKYSGDKAKMLTVKDPRAVYTKKMLDGRIEVFIRPEDVYDGTTNKSIAYLSSTHHLGDGNIALRDILSGDISTLHNKNLTEPVAPAESQPAPVTPSEPAPAPEAPKNNEIDYSGRDLFKIVNGEYVFLDGGPIDFGREHDRLGNLDDPYDMSKEYNICTPYNDIPMEKLVNKNIIVYGPSGEKEIFMFPDLQYMFSTEVTDNWNNTYLIRSQDLYANTGESRPIWAIDKSQLGERYLYSLTPHELLYNGPLVTRQNDEFHQ